MTVIRDEFEEYKVICSTNYKTFSEQVTALLTSGNNWRLFGDLKVTSPSMVYDEDVERTMGRETTWNQALVRLKYPLKNP